MQDGRCGRSADVWDRAGLKVALVSLAEACKYRVQVLGIRRETYVEFAFMAGDPALSVELVLPYPAFREFCASNRIEVLPIAGSLREAYARLAWRFGDREESRRWLRSLEGEER